MAKKPGGSRQREKSLSRERIVEVSIELLDGSGEGGLTFRALSERLSTGPGAIYWHIANKEELLIAACDAIVALTLSTPSSGDTPEETIRSLALAIFDAIDAHPWIGSALNLAPGKLPAVRIVERLGQQIQALGVPEKDLWATTSALLSYIFGVGGQNAANAQIARAQALDRSEFLGSASTTWSQLDLAEFPFVRHIAEQFRTHDDRADFLTGIDLILAGIRSR